MIKKNNKKNVFYVCTIGVLKDGEPTKEFYVLLCNDRDLNTLTKNLDKNVFYLEGVKCLGNKVSLNVNDFVNETKGLTTGSK